MVISRTLGGLVLVALGTLSACGSDDPAGRSSADAAGRTATDSTLPDIPFFDPDLAGLCESMDASFADGEPSPFLTPEEALANLATNHTGLEGLQLSDGKISLGDKPVGSYRLIDLPGDTVDIESAHWCYHDPSAARPTDDAAVGAAAAARLFDDNSFGGQDVFERINIVDNFGTDQDGFVVPNPDSPIPQPVRSAIERALEPLPVTWITDAGNVIVDERSDYTDDGAVLSIATPVIEGDTARITTSLWCGGTCGIGGAHELRRDDVGWVVVGTVGPQWIS